MTIKDLLQNKSIAIGLSIVGIVLLIALFSRPSRPAEDVNSGVPLASTTRLEIIDLNLEKREQAADYRRQIISVLPIYLENFKTGVGIDTTINIYALDDDPPEVVRLEIYGLSYLNSESDPDKNPNVVAYRESYEKAMAEIRAKGIDPKKLIFIYGDKEYVRNTTGSWIDSLNLRP